MRSKRRFGLWLILVLGVLSSSSGQADDAIRFNARKLFPLAESRRWEYQLTRRLEESKAELAIRLKCESAPDFEGRPSWVVLTRLGTGRRRSEVLQREYYSFTEAGDLVCYRRDNGPVAVALDPPQILLKSTMRVGDRWDWKGRFAGRPAQARFEVIAAETVEYGPEDKRVKTAALCISSEISIDDSEKTNNQSRKLWFAEGLGLVKEASTDRSGASEISIEAILIHAPEGD